MMSSRSDGIAPFLLEGLSELQEAFVFNINALSDVHPLLFKNADVLIQKYSVDPIYDFNRPF